MQIAANGGYGLYPNHRPFHWGGAGQVNQRTVQGTLHPGQNKIAYRAHKAIYEAIAALGVQPGSETFNTWRSV
jgi:hypothetical protein